ncbi:MAG: endolytic transglycosylase MltG [Bacteroidales bacterium]|nr:endolytic transglycosylase MltG [Bacteroidales bacterium]
MKRLILGTLSLVAVLLAFFAFMWLLDNRFSNFEGGAELYVRPGDRPEAVIDSIAAQTKIKHPKRLERVFANYSLDRLMQPGHYRVGSHMPSVYVARMLRHGWQSPVNLVLSGTLRRPCDIARKISRQMMVDSATVMAAFEDDALLARLGASRTTLFSLFMPDTYEMYWTDDIGKILERQKKAVDAFWTEENLALAAAQGLTRHEATVVASIVKGESNYAPEFPKIAGVYLNRLDRGMKLQADPTIAYCYDYSMNRILYRHLSIDSPYNTYLYAGLPPGPIAVPTRACLEAVLHPDRGNGNLYFCADPSFNGTHRFSTTYGEHLRNAGEFQRALGKRAADKKKASV